MIDGFKYVLKERGMGFLVMIKSVGQIGSGDILMVVFAERYFIYGEQGATSLGIMFAAAGLGSIIGPLVARILSGTTSGQAARVDPKKLFVDPFGLADFCTCSFVVGRLPGGCDPDDGGVDQLDLQQCVDPIASP